MRTLALLVTSLVLSGCVGKPRWVDVKLQIQLPSKATANGHRGFNPASATGFDCLAVNIMGPGIDAIASSPNADTVSEIVAGSSCSYPGILSELIPLTNSGEVTLKLPAGSDRVIQLLGILSTDNTCTAPIKDHFDDIASPLHDSQYPGIYEIGRAVADINSSQRVTIANAYDAADPLEVRCSTVPFSCSNPVFAQNSPFADGDGSAASPYKICNATQLDNVRAHLGGVFKLEADIDLAGAEWTPIGTGSAPFTGDFDGDLHSILNFQIMTVSPEGAGFFAVNSGVVRDTTFDTFTIIPSTTPAAGAVAAYNSGTLNNVVATNGVITATNSVGGSVGVNTGTIVNSAANTVTVTGNSTVGGFVGNNAGSITSSLCISGSVFSTATGNTIGGFVGTTVGPITACSSTSSVTANTSTDVGGFVGTANSAAAVISKCFATGNVSGGNHYFGGFVGNHTNAASISDSYARGSVTASGLKVGGFVGLISNSAVISRAYSNTTTVTGSGDVGGFGGYNNTGILADCFSRDVVALAGGGFSGTALLLSQFNVAASFTNFDFANVWDTNGDTVHPFLR